MNVFAGVDEAGRGPLCGAVVAAAVVLDPARPIDGLADSKKLTPKRRDALFELITLHSLAWCIASASVEEIDEINILQATLLAMRRAIEGLVLLDHCLDHVLVDGNQAPAVNLKVKTIIKGDMTEPCISAASILAKVHRDRLCLDMEREHPGYGFAAHKGYGTAAHVDAIRRLGPCALHRRTFEPVRGILAGRAG